MTDQPTETMSPEAKALWDKAYADLWDLFLPVVNEAYPTETGHESPSIPAYADLPEPLQTMWTLMARRSFATLGEHVARIGVIAGMTDALGATIGLSVIEVPEEPDGGA